MAVRPIITIPDPVLRIVAEPVTVVDDEIRTLMDDMLETMYAAPGVGLAAVQVGVNRRVVVLDVAREEDDRQPMMFANPEVTWTSQETSVHEEGCLSIPKIYEEVERPARCKVSYLDRDGVLREIHCDGMLATCIQHEIDHLNGILFIDHISRLKRERIVRKFAKAKRLLNAEAAE